MQEEGSSVPSSQSRQADSEGLTDLERSILEFERTWWRHAGMKEESVVARFGLTPTRYYQVLNRLIDTRAAREFDPMLVGRLQRIRERRRQADHGGSRQPDAMR